MMTSNATMSTSSSRDLANVKQWILPAEAAPTIYKPPDTNTNAGLIISRGTFGSISLAIAMTERRWRLAAIKTVIIAAGANNQRMSFFSTNNEPTTAAAPKKEVLLSPELFHEIWALQLLNPHPHIAELWNITTTKTTQVEMAFSYQADLALSLEWRRRAMMPPLSLPTIQGISRDLFAALNHCHSHGVLHLDVKPGNLLVHTARASIQLCDFGLAQPFSKDDAQSSHLQQGGEAKGICTLWYRPPERLLGTKTLAPSLDIFSAGLVLAELLAGFPLLRGTTDLGQLEATFQILGWSPQEEEWASHLPDFHKLGFSHRAAQPLDTVLPRANEWPGALQLLQQLLALNPARRPGACNVLEELQKTHNVDRVTILRELVPQSMREPLLLTNPHKDMSIATARAREMVATRKGRAEAILNSKWAGASKPFKSCKRAFCHPSIYYCGEPKQ
jgi:serine/threonine protein kinase